MENQEVFASEETNSEVQTRGLYKTAELTQLSMSISKEILKKIVEDQDYREQILESQKSNDAMDELIQLTYELPTSYDFLSETPAEEIEKMLKSQQSKRSRLKGKVMTLETYTNLMTAGVAESILRIASGNPKGHVGSSKRSDVAYSAEELIALASDQEALGKAIRNIQSKKCIAKGKAGFDPTTEEYQKILQVEATLKSIRVGKSPMAQEVVVKAEKADRIKEMLPDTDTVEHMSAKDVKALLAQINDSLKSE